MVGFSDIDRQFQPKPPATIRLECLNCGCADDTVQTRRPRWFNGFHDMPMCQVCGDLAIPTCDALIKERTEVLIEYYKNHPQPNYCGE
jgi:hypothetical protein